MASHRVQTPPTVAARVVTPGTLFDALQAVAAPDAQAVAGGTDLLVELGRGERPDLHTLVDLTRVEGLDELTITTGPEGAQAGDAAAGAEGADGFMVRLGSTVTHNRVVADPRLRDLATPLVQACREVGSPQLRNRATVVGNIVTASPANDTITALMALDAQVEIASLGSGGGQIVTRQVPLSEFSPAIRQTVLQPHELVTAVSFPGLDAQRRGVFAKLGLRRSQAISVVHVAVVATVNSEGQVRDARVALGSVGPTVVRADAAEQALEGRILDAATAAEAAKAAAESVDPIDDVRATAAYRKAMTAQMLSQALAALGDGGTRTDETPVLLQGRSGGRWPVGPTWADDHQLGSPVRAHVNGHVIAHRFSGESLLEWLRSAGLTGTKEGCAEGECGACTVELDDMAVMSCLVPATRAQGASITTIEGLSSAAAGGLSPLQQRFVDTGAVQCGYCIPGILMAGTKLLEETPNPDRQQILDGLAGNLCRCTGYYKIVDALFDVGSDAVSDASGVEFDAGADGGSTLEATDG